MATNAPDKCSVCTATYDEEEKAPRFLPCFHYCCTECIDNLILKQTKVCPHCRQSFQALSARNLSVNSSVLDFLKLMKEKEETLLESQERASASSYKETTLKELKKETKMLTKEIIGSYQETEQKIDSAIQSMKDLRDNLLQEVRLMQDDILNKVKKLLEKTLQKVQYVEEKIKTLEIQKEAMRSKQSQMEEAITSMDAANTFKHAGPLMGKVDEANTEAEKFLETFSQVMSSNEQNLHVIKKVAKDTLEKMRVIQEVLNSPAEGEDEMLILPHLQQLTIQEKVPQQITLHDIYQRNETMLKLIRQEKVYAEQEEGGRRRYARITLDEENRICVHHLSDERFLPLPDDAHLLQHDDVMSVVNTSCTQRAFLELGTDEESFGRIVFNLKARSKRAENFSALCSGLFGPSYVKTSLFGKRSLNLRKAVVVFGDYEFNNGEGGKEVIPGAGQERGGAWKGPQVAGSVGAEWHKGSAVASQFVIITKDDPNHTLDAIFSTVDTGLNVVRHAISRYSHIKKVSIIDSGIILPV